MNNQWHHTMNPSPSDNPCDAEDNARSLDIFSLSDKPTYPDRLGRHHISMTGMRQKFDNFMDSLDYVEVPYVAGNSINVRTQYVIAPDGNAYQVKPTTPLPYELTGDWATDSPNFMLMGDLPLRSELAGERGSEMVGFSEESSHPSGTVGFALAKLIEWVASRPEEGLKDLLFRQDSPDAVSRSALDKGRERVTPEDFGATGEGLILDTVSIQNAINFLGFKGGGELICNGTYLISNEIWDALCIKLHDNIHITGNGKFIVSPTTVVNGDRLIALMIGDYYEPSSNVSIKNISVFANQEAIGGTGAGRTKYIQGIGSQITDPNSQLKSSKNVTISDVSVHDVNIGIYCSKDTSADHSRPERIENQHRNWVVENSSVYKTQNKAIEFSECFGARASKNYLEDVNDGIQAIQGSRNSVFSDNTVLYRETGISATHNIRDFIANGNYCEAVSSSAYGAFIIRTEPYPDNSQSVNLTFSNNIGVDNLSTNKIVFAITGRNQNQSYKVINCNVSNNILSGRVNLYGSGETFNTGKDEVRNIRFIGNSIDSLESVPNSQSNTTDVFFSGNTITSKYLHKARNWRFVGNRFTDVDITSSAANTLFTGNSTSSYVNNGVNTQGGNNFN